MSLSIQEARKQLDDKGFFLGGSRRRAAVKSLIANGGYEAAEALVSAVDAGSSGAGEVRAALAKEASAPLIENLWRIWGTRRQEWLGSSLKSLRSPFAGSDQALRVLSRLKLGGGGLTSGDAAVGAGFLLDQDSDVRVGLRGFVGSLDEAARRAWAGALPIERGVALAVAEYLTPPGTPIAAAGSVYADRVIAAGPDFTSAFALKAGLGVRLKPSRATAIEVLRLRSDADPGLAAAATRWIGALPNDQQVNDVIVDEWLRSSDQALFEILRDQRRLSSDGGKEALLLLLWGDVKAYQALGDAEGRLLAEALAIVDAGGRERIVETLQKGRDAALADQLRRASMRVQGMDAGLGLRALLASGDEDRIVDAAREMKGRDLFDLVRRWSETGRRPKDPKKRAAVDQAVAALKNLPKIEVEPAPKLPDGLDDLLEVWAKHKASDAELQQDSQHPDPLVRARALFVGVRSGKVDQAVLKAKASSEDWLERFVAALNGAHPDPKNDHVYWITVCAGDDSGSGDAVVACGPDEFGRSQARLSELRQKATPLARVWAGELEALQALRALEMTTITVTADDAATQKGAIKAHGDVSAEDLANVFGGSGNPKDGRKKP